VLLALAGPVERLAPPCGSATPSQPGRPCRRSAVARRLWRNPTCARGLGSM